MNNSSVSLQTLIERKHFLEILKKEVLLRLTAAPPGTLRISSGHGYIQYYKREEVSDPNGSYLSVKSLNEIKSLAQKNYDQKLLKSIDRELKAIAAYQSKLPPVFPEDVFPNCSLQRQELIIPAFETEEQFLREWESFTYTGKGFPDDYPEFYTDKGERVRSKSEVIIADLLAKEGIPYRYECPIMLKGFGKAYPDFTVLNIRLRKEYLWEHLGMMDDPDYAAKAVRKQNYYTRNGYFPGENLIVTAETRNYPLNKQDLRLIIDHFLK